jgi:hypothetical protein
MKRIFPTLGVAILLLGLAWDARAWQSPAKAPPDITFPLDLAIVDPDSFDKLPPYVVMFEEGVDENGKDVKGPLARLEALRGASKMFPDSNKDPGLPVVLRGLRFHRHLGSSGDVAGYELELQGEFNTIKIPVSKEEMQKFLNQERVTFTLKGEKNFGIYSYVSTMKMNLQLSAGEIRIFSIDGDFTFREGFHSYTSKTKKLAPPSGRNHLYRGEQRDLPNLPSI